MSLVDSRSPRMQHPRRPVLAMLFDLVSLGRSRRRLLDLDSHMLRDIGLTPDQARNEAELPFWDAPQHWRR